MKRYKKGGVNRNNSVFRIALVDLEDKTLDIGILFMCDSTFKGLGIFLVRKCLFIGCMKE